MAEQRTRGSADDALATMNDHLARFFQHADVLLREWKQFGDELRASLDGQVRELQGTVAGAVTEAGRAAASKLEGQVQGQVAQSVSRSVNEAITIAVSESVAGLRRELDELTRLAAHGSARLQAGPRGDGATAGKARLGTGAGAGAGRARAGTRAEKSSGVRSGIFLLALTTANVMLAVLLIMNVHRCTGSDRPRSADRAMGASNAQGVAPASGDAGMPADATIADGADGAAGAAGEQEAMCATLAREYDAEAARAFVAASAKALCGDDTASQVIETLEPRLAAEADKPGNDGKKGKEDKSGSQKSDGQKSDSQKSDSKKSDSKKSDSKKRKSSADGN